MISRVIPTQEINASERDQFWQREEMEEKQRLEQERTRQEQNRRKLEEEIRKREEVESQLRDLKVIFRFIAIICNLKHIEGCPWHKKSLGTSKHLCNLYFHIDFSKI